MIECQVCRTPNRDDAAACVKCSASLRSPNVGRARRTDLDESPQPTPSFKSREGFIPSQPERDDRRRTELEEGPPAREKEGFRPPRELAPQREADRRTRLDDAVPSPDGAVKEGQAERRGGSQGRAARIVGWMISFDFNDTGQEYVIREGRNTVGRSRECEIDLWFDDRAGEKHAIIVYRGGHCAVKDEASTNGTFLNGEDIGIGATAALKSGDVLRFGKSTFKVYLLLLEEVRSLWPQIGAK
jgi:hypothetical protein